MLRVAAWNTRSWNNKAQEVLLELSRNKIDICALSETKKKGKGIMTYQDYVLFYSGVSKESRAKEGVAIAIHKDLERMIEKYEYISERIITVALKTRNSLLHVLSVYAPEDCKPKIDKDEFYDTLQSSLDKIPRNQPVLVLGDLNARIGNNVIHGIKNRFNEEACNDNGVMLTQFCADNELRINNTFFKHKIQHKITWQNNRNQTSILDYIVSNRNLHPSQILDVRSLNSADIGSDHSLVLCKLRLQLQKIKKKKRSPKRS